MKLLLIVMTAFVLYSPHLEAQTKTLDIDIRGRSCNGGSGLCTTSTSGGATNINMKKFSIRKLTSKSMEIEIETAQLSIEDQRTFFGKEYTNIAADEQLFFIQEQDFIFDINTLLYLELDPAFRLLKRGTYPIELVNDKVKVTVILSTQ